MSYENNIYVTYKSHATLANCATLTKCPALTTYKDRNLGAEFPMCAEKLSLCDIYKGYCPIRDGAKEKKDNE